MPPTIIGLDRGAKIKCIAGGHVEGTVMIGTDSIKPFNEVNQKIKSVFKQLEGKTIGVAKEGSIHDVMLRDIIQKVGMEKSIKVKNYEITDFILIDMQDKIVEAAVGTPALATLLTQSLNAKIIIPPSDWWPYNPSYGIVVSDFLIKEFPEVVENLVRLHKKACTDLREKPVEIAKMVEKELEFINHEFILKVYANSPKYCAALPIEYIKSTIDFLDVLKKLGYVKKEFSESDIFDLTFIKKVHPEKHHYNDGINLMNQ